MTLEETFEEITDDRIEGRTKHKLVDILMIVFFGILCGYKTIEEIHFYAEMSINALKKYLKLENGIPGSDTILRVLARIDSKELENAFVRYAKETFGDKVGEDEVIAIDGKTIRNSGYQPESPEKTPHKASHVVSAWATNLGVCFGQVKTDEKSNEIKAIPELLELLDLKGVIVTIDAMGCQKKIAEKITEKKSNYVISLKGNQEKIHADAKSLFEHELDEQYCERYKIQHTESEIEFGHGRIEKRSSYLCTNLRWLEEKSEWTNLNGIGMVVSERTDKKTGQKSTERRYFLTSLTDVSKASNALRSHWSVENNLHWVLDNIFDEDHCLVRKDNAAQNLNVIRKIAMNLLKQADFSDVIKSKNITISQKQHICDKCEDYLDRVIKLF